MTSMFKMGSLLIVNGFVIVIAIYSVGLLRPVSCRRTISAKESYLESADLRIFRKCHRKCHFIQSRLRKMVCWLNIIVLL